MHLKALPSSSAWDFPMGVNSPPHFKISSNVGFLESSLFDSEFVFRPLNFLFMSIFRLSFNDFNCILRLMPEKWPYLGWNDTNKTLIYNLMDEITKIFRWKKQGNIVQKLKLNFIQVTSIFLINGTVVVCNFDLATLVYNQRCRRFESHSGARYSLV